MHVLTCPEARARAQWNKSIEKLEKWMKSVDTSPALQRQLLRGLKVWVMKLNQSRWTGEGIPGLKEAMEAQSRIGWDNFVRGRISKKFEEFQQRHYLANNNQRSGFRWTVELIKKLMDVAWDMWDHRNGILHKDTDGHRHAEQVMAANVSIHQEMETGAQGLLPDDKFLFQHKKEDMKDWNLDRKLIWLKSVTLAREAAKIAASQPQRHEEERQRMRSWLRSGRIREHNTEGLETRRTRRRTK